VPQTLKGRFITLLSPLSLKRGNQDGCFYFLTIYSDCLGEAYNDRAEYRPE